MLISVFSDKKNIRQGFERIIKSRSCSIAFLPVKEFSSELKKQDTGRLLYLDLSSVSETDRKKYLISIFKYGNRKAGIIDPDNSVTDVAELFHSGIADYIGKTLFKTGITLKRIEAAFNFSGCGLCASETENVKGSQAEINYIPSGSDWELIKPGKEYTFCFMFIELDDFRDMKKTAGLERAKKIADAFHKFLGNYTASFNGRIWIWMEYTALVLIPYDGDAADVILSSFKLMLNRHLINAIDLGIDYTYSWHIALHVGNTVYRERGETGTIVSDSINSIFHLGQKYADNRSLYLTEEAVSHIPAGIKEFFTADGEFEGRKIVRMKKLV